MNEAKASMIEKGRQCMFSLFNKVINYNIDFDTAMHIFDRAAIPVMTYGSELWNLPLLNSRRLRNEENPYRIEEYYRDSPLERIHYKYLKVVLGVGKYVSTEAVLWESGRYPLFSKCFKQAINFWQHAKNASPNSLVYKAYCADRKLADSGRDCWGLRIKYILDYFNLPQIWNANAIVDARETEGKLAFYAEFKSDLIKESYLSLPFHLRKWLCKFRICNHRLAIETGRYTRPKTERQSRFCKHCTMGVVEDESHFAFECPYYRHERKEFSKVIINLTGIDLEDYLTLSESKRATLTNLLNSNDMLVLIALAKFVRLACERNVGKVSGWASQTEPIDPVTLMSDTVLELS